MAGRAIWKGNVHLPGVDVAVKLLTAVKEERVQFHLLHKSDQVRLKQQMICAFDQEPVPVEEQARGFELEKGRYLLVDPAELEQAEPKESRTIEVREFVKTGQIDPLFRERLYTLEPDGPAEGYRTLAAAMAEAGVEGICTWAMRKRSYFGALQADGGWLCLNVLRYADEVLALPSSQGSSLPLSEKELRIGSELIRQLTAPFQPEKFVDEHQAKLRQLIDKKARGEKIAILRPRRRKPTADDQLLRALEASLKKVA